MALGNTHLRHYHQDDDLSDLIGTPQQDEAALEAFWEREQREYDRWAATQPRPNTMLGMP